MQTNKADELTCVISIVAVHGLGAHPDHAWVRHGVAADDGRHVDARWLTDFLPGTFQQHRPPIRARIFYFSYQSKWLGQALSKNRLEGVARRLLDDMQHVQVKVS